MSTTQQKAHKTPAAATARTPKLGLEITAAPRAFSLTFYITQRDGLLSTCQCCDTGLEAVVGEVPSDVRADGAVGLQDLA